VLLSLLKKSRDIFNWQNKHKTYKLDIERDYVSTLSAQQIIKICNSPFQPFLKPDCRQPIKFSFCETNDPVVAAWDRPQAGV